MGLLRLFCLAAAVPVLLAATAPAPDRLSLRIEVYGPAGLHVVTNSAEIEESGERYNIKSFLTTRGLASVFVDITNTSEVRGRLTGNSAKPEMFRSHTVRNGVDRRDFVDYRPDGTVNGGGAPPDGGDIVPVSAAQTPGTVDNLTAYFLIERRLGQTGNCNLTVPVYDGRHRYDLVFKDEGEETLAPESGQNYAGKARRCRMHRQEIAGFPTDRGRTEGARDGTIWYGRLVQGDLYMPIRMELDTEIGRVDAFLAELHGRGANLKLIQ